jgi:acyl carrier protein
MQPAVSSIQKLLNQKLNIYPGTLTLQTELKKDLNLADWEMLYLLNAVERAWQISIPPADSDNIVRIDQLLAVVKKQRGSRLH